MSKIGFAPIKKPDEVQVEIISGKCLIKGKEGEISIKVPSDLGVELNNNQISVKRKKETKKIKSRHGLFRKLIANAVSGVQKPWEKRLEVVGTGYTAQLQGDNLLLKLGFSHPVNFPATTGIKYEVQENKITILGIDKQLVGQVAHRIRSLKKPDAYKGKGIKYEGEKIKLKPGKKTGAMEGATT